MTCNNCLFNERCPNEDRSPDGTICMDFELKKEKPQAEPEAEIRKKQLSRQKEEDLLEEFQSAIYDAVGNVLDKYEETSISLMGASNKNETYSLLLKKSTKRRLHIEIKYFFTGKE